MTRKCPSCSADVLDNAKFCIKCGTKMPALTPSPSVASSFAPPSPAPSTPPIREQLIPEPVSISDSVNAPSKEVVPQQDRSSVKEEVRPSNSASSNKIEPNTSKSGSKGIIFAVIGVVIVGGGAFVFMSNKQTPTQAPTPAATISPPVAPTPVAPAAAPANTSAPVAPVVAKPAPKPVAPAAPESNTPDINKIMRDAANK